MNQNYRNNDPPTSALAGRSMEASGIASQQRLQCLDAVAHTPGATAREIEQRIGIKAHKRLPELRRSGAVRNGKSRICKVTGRRAMTWYLRTHANTAGHPHQTTPAIGAQA